MRFESGYRNPAVASRIDRVEGEVAAQNAARRSQSGLERLSQFLRAFMQRDETASGLTCAQKIQKQSQSQADTLFCARQIDEQGFRHSRRREQACIGEIAQIVAAALLERRVVADDPGATKSGMSR